MTEHKPQPQQQPFQKESIINLQNFQEKDVRIKFLGGREIQGVLKGYDTSLNMVLDGCIEFLRGILIKIIKIDQFFIFNKKTLWILIK